MRISDWSSDVCSSDLSGTNVPMCRLPRVRNIEAELLDMKDRVVRTRVQQRSSADWSDLQWPAPLASPAPELEGVADELRQLYETYSDNDEVHERPASTEELPVGKEGGDTLKAQ